jgi:hypothetical protein
MSLLQGSKLIGIVTGNNVLKALATHSDDTFVERQKQMRQMPANM